MFQIVSYVITVSLATIVPPFTAVPLELSAPSVFGTFPSLIFTILGNILGGAVAFLIAKRFGWELMYKMFDDEKVKKVKKVLVSYGFWYITISRTALSSLWDAFSYACGLTKMTLSAFILSSLISTIPSTTIIILFGSTINLSYVFTIWTSVGIFAIALYVVIKRWMSNK